MRELVSDLQAKLGDLLGHLDRQGDIDQGLVEARVNSAVTTLQEIVLTMLSLDGESTTRRMIDDIQSDLIDLKNRPNVSNRGDTTALWRAALEAFEAVQTAVKAASQTPTHALSDPEVRQRVRALTDGRCSYCDCDLPDNWHIDHVVPKSAGGPDNIANYVPSCPTCNISKNGNHVLDFIKKSRGKVVAFRSEGAA